MIKMDISHDFHGLSLRVANILRAEGILGKNDLLLWLEKNDYDLRKIVLIGRKSIAEISNWVGVDFKARKPKPASQK